MMALATSDNPTTDKNVMSISTNARIDYILKFSRHTVVVLDDQQSGFGSIAGTFLASLSEQTNAALVPVSSKLNDVQIRARINEQLFPGEAFDPEISLTQSVIEHYINQQLPIAIVIEQAHHLSLQIVHELTLLSELAKKSGREIAVVLLGQPALGKLITTNYSLFNKKLSMISAANGQLLSANAELFKSQVTFLALTPFNKLVIALVALLALTFVTLYFLYQRDAMSFSKLAEPTTTSAESNRSTPTKEASETNASDADTVVLANGKSLSDSNADISAVPASPQDILQAILAEQSVAPEPAAAPVDVLTALAAVDDKPAQASFTQSHPTQQALPSGSVAAAEKAQASAANIEHSEREVSTLRNEFADGNERNRLATAAQKSSHQFDVSQQGVVIQFANLALQQALKSGKQPSELARSFAQRYQLTDYQYYTRMLNSQPYLVITSKTYIQRDQAVLAMAALDEALQQAGIWIKSTATVQKEMAAVSR
ncbi:hypothetical protein DXX93_19270 [Thalassotalea euphylliae]|uniref:SPOR domain-containing protein n=1 Tax=Thalassotalea euphylliae TaxID=1655234 RepID=A0A3E0TUZ0_9GAMM|nr:ATP-binding protein [Thalassotalea euphylliae]REL28496.1 hypothetical protein DXX93_19270 [Thalassotalea euphylliae]